MEKKTTLQLLTIALETVSLRHAWLYGLAILASLGSLSPYD